MCLILFAEEGQYRTSTNRSFATDRSRSKAGAPCSDHIAHILLTPGHLADPSTRGVTARSVIAMGRTSNIRYGLWPLWASPINLPTSWTLAQFTRQGVGASVSGDTRAHHDVYWRHGISVGVINLGNAVERSEAFATATMAASAACRSPIRITCSMLLVTAV